MASITARPYPTSCSTSASASAARRVRLTAPRSTRAHTSQRETWWNMALLVEASRRTGAYTRPHFSST